jgi:hypothetical protein
VETIDVVLNTKDDSINFAASTTLNGHLVPVPATLVLCFSGLPVAGLGWLRARRNKK